METLWNEDRIGRLETLYRDGYSFTLIAADIGMSRNATIGKARRLELPQRINLTKCKPREAPFVTPKRDRFGAVAMIPEPEPIPERDYRCTILELDDSSCRYPLWQSFHGERWYCGHPTARLCEGRPYCDYHANLCGNEGRR